jgi:glyoxylase-like metal-dependent hydrolase (beta-lactamase superfamily II)
MSARPVVLTDTEGSFATVREAFGVADDTPWRLPFDVFLVRAGDANVLVDTGLGPPGDDPFLPEREGLLPRRLAEAGFAPEDVDLVVHTHLHVDHVGWNMHDGEPFFPRARHVAHQADFEFFTRTRGDRPYVREQLVALRDAGRLDLVDGDAEPMPGVLLEHVPGHTPGHCIVRAGGAVFLGDLAVHELQLADPGIAYVAEEDPAAAATERRRLLPQLANSGSLVAIPHLGLGWLAHLGLGFRWVPITD